MAKKRRKNTSETQNEENQDVKVSEEIVKVDSDSAENNIEAIDELKIEEASQEAELDAAAAETQDAIDAAVKEYNGEIKEEKRIKIREKADVANMKQVSKKAIIISLSVILAMIISFIAIATVNKMNSNVYRNVYLESKNLTGMTTSELTDYLNKQQESISKQTLKIIQDEEKILEIVPEDIDFKIDVSAVQEDVFGFGRKSNILKNNIDVFYALICKKEFDVVYKYDVAKLAEIIKEIKESLDNKVINDSYIVDENEHKLIITKGKSGNTIDEIDVKNNIIASLANKAGEYKLDIIKGTPTELDVDVVYSQVKREAKDAYIDKTTTVYKFVPHVVGLDFSKEDLSNLLSKEENKKEEKVIEFALKVIEPKVKTSDVYWEMYDYQISTFSTNFSTVDPNRVNNLRVALNLINGKVIMPGEVFSYNSVVGGATAAQGFKAAATFVGGRIVREVGGGICQTVSTLYNTVLLANLEIVQRKAHSLPVGYVPPSRDATVYYPSIDFKFKNTRQYPIKIVTSFNSSGSLTISLFGTKEENEYVVSITSKTLSTIKFQENSSLDNSLEKGKVQVVQEGSNGYTSEAYITKKLNGKIVSTTLLSRDTYKAVNKIVKIGNKEVYVAPAPAPTPTPAPAPTVPEDTQGNNTNQDTSGSTTTQPESSGNQNNTTNPNE